jgi:hypothetical protein
MKKTNTSPKAAHRKYRKQATMAQRKELVELIIKAGEIIRKEREAKAAKQKELASLAKHLVSGEERRSELSTRLNIAFYRQLIKHNASQAFVTEVVRCLNAQFHRKKFVPDKKILGGLTLEQAKQVLFNAQEDAGEEISRQFMEEFFKAQKQIRTSA